MASDHTVIRGGRLLDAAAHRAEPADVLIEGTTIREIGPAGLAAPEAARTIDARDRLLMPGLVNAHTHGHGSVGKGLGDRWSLELLLNALPWANGGLAEEDLFLAAQLNAAEMLRKGSTAAYDLFLQFPLPDRRSLEAIGRAYSEAGVRVVLAPMMANHSLYEAVPGLMQALPEALRRQVEASRAAPLASLRHALAEWLDDWPFDRDRVRPALAPTIPTHCSDEFLVLCRDTARDQGVGVHMHLAESKPQALAGQEFYGQSLAAHLDRVGLLGPDFTAAHGIWLDDDDLKRLADRGAAVAHNPGSNLRLGCGIAPVREMLARRLTVGVGSDGSVSSDNQNVFEAARLASFVSRVRSPDPEQWITAEEALRMATEGGAAVLGMDDRIGRIAPGYYADIVFLDLGAVGLVPLNDPVHQLVHSEDGSAVDSVMVGGRLVLEHGRFTGFDYGRLRTRLEQTVARMRDGAAEAKALADQLEPVVARHCIGLARRSYHVERLCCGW